MKTHIMRAVGALLIAAASTTVIAQQGGGTIVRDVGPTNEREIERSAVNFAGPWRPGNSNGVTKVVGTVIDIRMVPVANARVQLRNLDDGSITEEGLSNEDGEYEFETDEPGTYVVEMIMTDGYIVALSNAGALSRFETMNTVIQLPGRWDAARAQIVPVQTLTGYFGMSAQTTMTATTLELAVNDNVSPTDPGTKVSP